MKGPESVQIQKMFGEVSSRYDIANTVLSFGVHHLWRKSLAKKLIANLVESPSKFSILDCATGTGDVLFEVERQLGAKASYTGTDFCVPMLTRAQAKADQRNSKIEFKTGDVTGLAMESNTFDAVTISFGIRNTENPEQALREMLRVVKPGGIVYVLEFGKVDLPGVSAAYEFYRNKVLPRIGGWLTGKPKAYQYLHQSSAAFPSGNAFLNLAQGIECCNSRQFERLSQGIAYLYTFKKAMSS